MLAFAGQQPARADAIDNLLDRLKEKGVITQDEYNELKDVRDGEKAVARQRRKEANEEMTKKEEVTKSGVQGYFRDGIVWESADKKTSIGLNGRVQLDYRNYSGEDALNADTFDVRRAYLGVNGKFWDYYTFDVTADFASLSGSSATVCTAAGLVGGNPACTATTAAATQSNSHLDVAWLNAAWWKPVQFRFGQFKMPFSLEELTSSRFIDFQERSFVNAFVPAKERGIMVHGEPKTGIFYGLAISTGQGKNNNDTSVTLDSNDYIARVATNFAQLANIPNSVFHLGVAYTTGDIPPAAAPSLRTEGRGISFFRPAAFTSPANQDVDRTRLGVEGAVAWGPVKLQTEAIKNTFEGTSAAGVAFDRELEAYYASISWLITGENWADAYRGGSFGRIRPKNNFKVGGGGKGAWELGVRFSKFDGSEFTTTNPVGTGVLAGANEADALTVGIKWLPTPNTRFLLNYIKTDFEQPITVNNVLTDDEKAFTLRAQFDF